MPARSNKFQQIVRAIQGHLSKTGSVKESRFLRDRDTNSSVEVDIVIEENVGGHTILIGIECTSGKRKATIEWYREMKAKHADLPISKTILVSESGFTKEVIKKAPKDNITLLTLKEINEIEWGSFLQGINLGVIADVGFTLDKVEIKSPNIKELNFPVTKESVVKFRNHEIPLDELIMRAALDNNITTKVMAQLGSILKKTNKVSFEFNLPEESYFINEFKKIQITAIRATLLLHHKFQKLTWKTIEFNGQPVATSNIPASFLFPAANGDAVVTASKMTNNKMRVSMLSPTDNDIEIDVFPNALWNYET